MPSAPVIVPLPLSALPAQPLVSVLIANYNYGRFIDRALDSLLAQSYRHFEGIVCDDGSTDDSREVVARYARRDARIRLLEKENGGVASALNMAYRACRGDVVGGLGERRHLTTLHRAGPPELVPHQPRRPAEHCKVDQFNGSLVFRPHHRPASRTRRPRASILNMDPDRFARSVGGSENRHVAEPDEELADSYRVDNHRGPRLCWRQEPSESQGPCTPPGTLTRRSLPPQVRRAAKAAVPVRETDRTVSAI